jgi:hypothetical protein
LWYDSTEISFLASSPFFISNKLETVSFNIDLIIATILGSGQTSVELTAEGLGIGGQVIIKQFNLKGIVQKNIAKGELVTVRVSKIVSENRIISLELVE